MKNVYHLCYCYSTLCIIFLNGMVSSESNAIVSSSIFFIEPVEIAEAKVTAMEEKVADAEKELSKAKTWAAEAEGEFRKQKKCTDGLSKNIVHLVMKLGKANASLALMQQKMTDVCQGEA